MKNILRQLAVIVTTIYALVLNGAANAIPLGGHTTGAISDSFQVLFVPAGYVFAIWGVIYLGLLAYTIYHSLPAQRNNIHLRRTGWLVALSSLGNGTWILFWQYLYFPLSLLTMFFLLAVLVVIYLRLDIGHTQFSNLEKWVVSIPFSIYLGWITVATIANVTVVLSPYTAFTVGGISATAWTVILLVAGVVIAGLMAFTRSDIAYLLVLVWAFAGISVKWVDMSVLSYAGYVAAAVVLVLLVASRLRPSRQTAAG